MTLAEYSNVLHQWCQEVESEALALFKSGVAVAQCTGLAISIVEARRQKQASDRAQLAIPGRVSLPRA